MWKKECHTGQYVRDGFRFANSVQTHHRPISIHANYLLDMCNTPFGDNPKSANVLESSERRCFGNPKYN